MAYSKADTSSCGMPHQALAKRGKAKCPGCGAKLTLQEALVEAAIRDGDLSVLHSSDFALLRWTLQEAADSMAKASTPEPFSKSKTSNWVARQGGLPAYAQHIAHDLVEKRGMSVSRAIATAIAAIKRWAAGVGNVDSGTRAAARKALAEWESKKAATHAK